MYLTYGGYRFPDDGVTITTSQQLLRNEAGFAIGHSHRWVVKGVMFGDTPLQNASLCAAMERALSVNGRDLVFRDDSGTPVMFLYSALTTTGVLISEGPNYPEGGGAEWANRRTFEFVATADVALTGRAGVPLVLSFFEEISTAGGGPFFAHLQPVNGPPVKQMVFQQTPYTALQSGSAVGLLAYPTPPRPLWPGALKRAPEIRRRGRAVAEGRGQPGFEVSWVYEFESVSPLVGLPHTA